jgi:hypothetical protein
MLRTLFTTAATIALFGAAIAPGMAEARPHRDHDQPPPRYERGYDSRDRGYYEARRRHERCRSDGTAGTIIGAIAGGLLGNDIGNGRHNNRDGTGGAIVGAGLGALAGRAIDRDC